MFAIRLKKAGEILLQNSYERAIIWLIILGILVRPAPVLAGPLQLGIEAVQRQDYVAAVQNFSQAIAAREQLEAAYGDRCLTYLLMNKLQPAIAD